MQLEGPIQLFYLIEQDKPAIAYGLSLTHYHATVYKYTAPKNQNFYQVLYNGYYFPPESGVTDEVLTNSKPEILKLLRIINQINVERTAAWKKK